MNEKNLIEKKLFNIFQVNGKLIKKEKRSYIMHCLLANRNKEIISFLNDSCKSTVWLQVINRMYVQQSILHFCINSLESK